MWIRIILAMLLLASTAGGQRWEQPDTLKNGRVHHNNARHSRIAVDDSTFTLAMWDSLDAPAYMRLMFSDIPPEFFEMSGDTIIIGLANFTFRMYVPDTLEGLEWEVVFDSKPNKSSWTFPIETENLQFSYQGELTQQEIDNGDYRPDSVIGSYAVYHSSRSWNEYKTGKAYHIYRPKAWDSAGDTVWLDLSIDTVANTMTVAGKRSWFRNAVYPVTIDPYFGQQSIGGTSTTLADWDNPDHIRGCSWAADQYAASGGETVDTVYLYAKKSGGGTDQIAGSIYDVSVSMPNNKVGTPSGWVVTGASYIWVPMKVFASLSNGVTYTCMFAQDASILSYKDTETNASVHQDTSPWPDPFSSGGYVASRLSMYAHYTTAGAPTAAQFINIGGQ